MAWNQNVVAPLMCFVDMRRELCHQAADDCGSSLLTCLLPLFIYWLADCRCWRGSSPRGSTLPPPPPPVGPPQKSNDCFRRKQLKRSNKGINECVDVSHWDAIAHACRRRLEICREQRECRTLGKKTQEKLCVLAVKIINVFIFFSWLFWHKRRDVATTLTLSTYIREESILNRLMIYWCDFVVG